MIGEVLGGVRLEAVIGHGRFGHVYRGTDVETGDTVAARVLDGLLGTPDEVLSRMEREFRVARSLEHPHLVRNLRLETGAPAVVMVMQYVRGPDISRMLEDGPVPIPDAVAIAAQVARALGYVHDHGFVHRDIKPPNVLVEPGPRAVLGDLELIKPFGDEEEQVTETGYLVGTPGFLAPEILAEDVEANPWTDMYSLGATFYALFGGCPPFPGRSASEIFARALKDAPPPLASLRPETPPGVVEVIERLMSRNPARRIARGEEVARRLEAALASPGG